VTEPAAWVRARLGIEPGDARLFAAALTHRSASGANNERLEFLGDAVLNLIVADILYRRFPEASEGDLSRLRARVVSTEPLAEIAVSLGLGEALRLGSGELKTGGFRRASILADAFEALCGACYLDGGLQAARDALQPLVLPRIEALPDPSELKDAKTRLQEYLQSRGVFDACIVDARADPPIAAIAIRGFQYDRNLLARPYGLQGVRVLQAITDAGLGQELVRWEYGTLPGTQKRIGTPAEWEDLIRAYTGISTDRFADAQKLDHSQRMDAILRSAENPPLQLYPVFKYLREASDASEFRFARKGSNLRQLTDEEATKLKAIGTRICSATPVVKSYSSKQVDCPKAYNELIRNAYPEQADALML